MSLKWDSDRLTRVLVYLFTSWFVWYIYLIIINLLLIGLLLLISVLSNIIEYYGKENFCWIFSVSSLLVRGLSLAMIFPILNQGFSIGLRSGDWAGQSIVFTPPCTSLHFISSLSSKSNCTDLSTREYRMSDIVTSRRKQLITFHNNAYCTQTSQLVWYLWEWSLLVYQVNSLIS